EAQKRARDRFTFASWGTRLTVEQFCAREQRLRQHRWPQAAMRTWLLCGDDGEVLCSCETFRMRSFHRGEDGWTQAVASVLTEPALRRSGYASTLIAYLMRELTQQGVDLHASILFSDVGASLYQRAGFEAVPAGDWVFPVESGPPAELADQLIAEPQVQ